MSIDNKAAATRYIYLIICAVLVTLYGLLTCILFRITHLALYISILLLLALLTYKLVTIKYFKLELSEDLISIKYNHPLIKRYRSANLELPWYKISFCQLEKHSVFNYIRIGVYGRYKNKVFIYNLGILASESIDLINEGILKAKENQNNHKQILR